MIRLTCPHCGQSLDAGPEAAGRKARCPSCLQMAPVPDTDETATFGRLRVPPVATRRAGRQLWLWLLLAPALFPLAYLAALLLQQSR